MSQSIPGNTDTTHPMDDIPVRKLVFDYERVDPDNPVWSKSSPLFAIFANAFNIHVPYFERYLIRTMVKAKRKIDDPKLLADVEAIIGQEAAHANAFINFNAVLKKRYPDAEKLEKAASDDLTARMKTDTFKEMVGFTAGYETFTFLAGMMILDNYDKWLADSDPVVKAMWVWHQVEEVEHAAVAFDVYKYFFGEDEAFRKKMIWAAYRHIVGEVLQAYWHMCRMEGYLRNPWRFVKAMTFITRIVATMSWSVRPVFSKTYHPRNHPLATTKQNPVAVGWRRFHKKGGDVLEIDREKMSRILGIALPKEAWHPAQVRR